MGVAGGGGVGQEGIGGIQELGEHDPDDDSRGGARALLMWRGRDRGTGQS